MGKRTPEPTMIPTETDLAWAAGIIDGEGCIFVKAYVRKWVRHEVRLNLTNTSEPMIRKFIAMFGGGFSVRKKPNCRRIAQWEITGQRAGNVLRSIIPYLIAKLPEAKLALEAVETLVPRNSYNANSRQGAPRPPLEVIERRQTIREELQRLKRIEHTFN